MKEQLHNWLKTAHERGASDLHLTVGMPPVYRVNGRLQWEEMSPLTVNDTSDIAKAVLRKEQYAEFIDMGELDFSYGIPQISRFRVNIFKQRSSISLAFRVVPTKVPTLEELQLPSVLKKMTDKPHGLILVVGPTGSGKSTTLAAMIHHMNLTQRKHIITLEDPIEYIHNHKESIVDQREIGFDTMSFANGLRAALRQDPDVILVGELRDHETISTAVTAAETGHLVLGTLHTNDAPSTIDRMIDVFPSEQQAQIRIQLASELISIISQRLFPTPDYTSRRAALEILINNSAVGNLIRNEKTFQIPNVMQTSRASGMQTMSQAIRFLLSKGAIAVDAAEPYIPEVFK